MFEKMFVECWFHGNWELFGFLSERLQHFTLRKNRKTRCTICFQICCAYSIRCEEKRKSLVVSHQPWLSSKPMFANKRKMENIFPFDVCVRQLL